MISRKALGVCALVARGWKDVARRDVFWADICKGAMPLLLMDREGEEEGGPGLGNMTHLPKHEVLRRHGVAVAGGGRRLLRGHWANEMSVCFEVFEKESGRRLYTGVGPVNLYSREDPEDPVRKREGEREGGREKGRGGEGVREGTHMHTHTPYLVCLPSTHTHNPTAKQKKTLFPLIHLSLPSFLPPSLHPGGGHEHRSPRMEWPEPGMHRRVVLCGPVRRRQCRGREGRQKGGREDSGEEGGQEAAEKYQGILHETTKDQRGGGREGGRGGGGGRGGTVRVTWART